MLLAKTTTAILFLIKKKPLTAVTATGNDVIAAIIETILRTAAVAAETAKMFNDVSTALY